MEQEAYQIRILDLVSAESGQKVLVVNTTNDTFVHDLQKKGFLVERNQGEDTKYNEYDLIFLFGMDVQGGTSDVTNCLQKFMHRLKPNGQLLWCVDNKLGMKYWSGMQYEKGGFFRTLESEETELLDVTSHRTLIEILDCVVKNRYTIYYPYPDYRYPLTIYSDAWLPHKGELENFEFNFEYFKYRLFDESKVWNNIIAEGLFREFANSFIVLIERS